MQMQSDCYTFNILQVEYKLKWRGWDSGDNTWEPEEHLHCAELIKSYEATQVKKSQGERLQNYSRMKKIHLLNFQDELPSIKF